jgi:glycerol kinase
VAVVLAIDAGTTGVRALAVDETGRPVGWAYRELTQHFPRPGWVEHDADEIWSAVEATTAEVTERLGQPASAIGITNQRETVVAWDRRTGAPLHRALVWQDRRTADRCAALAEHLPTVRERTGLVLDPYFSATKLAWLFDEGGIEPTADVAVGTIDAWLLFKLTGEHVTDTTNASRTSLFDIRTLAWSDELCELFGVPRHVLPEVRPSCGRFGTTPTGVPVSGVAGDQQAALFGQACVRPGMAKNTYGTGSFVLMNVGATRPPPVDGLLTTVAWTIGDDVTYAFEGAVFATGAAVQWLRDELRIIDHASETEALAASIDSTDGVYVVPAFTGLGSPWWDPHTRGTIVGITRGTGRTHLARAVLESMAFQTRDVVDVMSVASGHPIVALRADGGASENRLLLQLQADQLGVPVQRPAVRETTALGAAYLAGLAEGVWSSLDDVTSHWHLDTEVQPSIDRTAADLAHAQWLRAVDRARAQGNELGWWP